MSELSCCQLRSFQVEQSNLQSVWPLSIIRWTCSMWRHDFGCPCDRGLCDRVNFVGRGFERRTKQYEFCIGPGFDSQARSPVAGQCDPWPVRNFVRWSEENKYIDQSVLDQTEFSLEYNSVDKWLLEQSLIEIKHVL